MSQLTDAVVAALYANASLTPLLGNAAQGIGHLQVEEGVVPDWVIVADLPGTYVYTFGNEEAYGETQYAIKAIVKMDGNGPRARADAILAQIYSSLQNVDLTVVGRKVMSLRKGRDLGGRIETINANEQYLHVGSLWDVVSQES